MTRLFEWIVAVRLKGRDVNPQQLVAELEVEALPWADCPAKLSKDVTKFRHLNSAARLAAARRWLAARPD